MKRKVSIDYLVPGDLFWLTRGRNAVLYRLYDRKWNSYFGYWIYNYQKVGSFNFYKKNGEFDVFIL
ncbi:hypothetical protein [Elizabethkingia meningoseptica]|uniref:hypothetical protein n=1 Tax=Elizabethkingia meningoseptica TaxID=238 RepID=UPI00315920CD